jgi:nitrite reductase/ring-hydroxylating ferredoxin subunit
MSASEPSLSGLRERDGHLVNNWYIACLSDELQGAKPIQRVIYERPYVLFRDQNGAPACLPDRCLHRATNLSAGNCHEGKLTCPYHGWKYDATGAVVEIPSEKDMLPRNKMRLKPQPAVEQDGCIWVWMGEGEPDTAAPPWKFPEFGNKAWSHYFMVTDFENEVTDLAENFMDVPHTIFVHRGWFRDPARKRVPFTLQVENGRVLATYQQPDDKIGFSSFLLNPKKAPMVHTDEYIFPNITRVDYHFGDFSGFIINSQCTPVGHLKSRVYTYIAYRVGAVAPLLKPFMRFYTRQVIEQDVVIMRNQGNCFKLDPSRSFKSTDADEIHVAIERIREMGVRNDPNLMTFKKHKEKEFWI